MSPAIHLDCAAPALIEHESMDQQAATLVGDALMPGVVATDPPATLAAGPKKRYRAFPTELRPVAVLADCQDLQIELTAMLIGKDGVLLELVSHERHPQRVSIFLPGRQLHLVGGMDARRLTQQRTLQGTSLTFELGSRDSEQLRFQLDHQGRMQTAAGKGARVLLQALGVVLEPLS